MAVEDKPEGTTARARVEQRLRQLAMAASGPLVDELELRHLVHVILHSSLLLKEAYTDERLRAILEADVRTALSSPLLGGPFRSEPEALSRLSRLPDDVRAFGNQCLFDVGITGLTEIHGLSLPELGVRAYRLASELIEHLASDAHLKRFFDANRLHPLPIGEEVSFLRQCARRFNLHAELLHRLSLLDPGEGESREADRAGSPLYFPVGSSGGAIAGSGGTAPEGAERPGAAEAPPGPQPPGPGERGGAAGAEAPPAERGGAAKRTREELLSSYERLLLFAGIDAEALRAALSRVVIGQPEAIDTICEEFSLHAAGTHDPDRPASYFFVGPTGVGKNHVIETLVAYLSRLWGVEVPFLQIEGPNYTEASDINELRGSTRGFIRSDEDGMLAEFHERASRAPFSCLLVDEVEKAHPHFRKFFLSLMDRGTLTDNRGRTLRFPGSMLVFTSNVGYGENAVFDAPIGYRGEEQRPAAEASRAERDIRRALSPEFMNRLRIVRFRHLERESIERIFDLELGRIAARFLEVHGLAIGVTPGARRELISRGYSYRFGARHLAGVIDRHCNVEVARKIRSEELPREENRTRLVAWLREIRDGERAFDAEEVRARVLEEARARLPYNRVDIDFDGGAFTVRGRS